MLCSLVCFYFSNVYLSDVLFQDSVAKLPNVGDP